MDHAPGALSALSRRVKIRKPSSVTLKPSLLKVSLAFPVCSFKTSDVSFLKYLFAISLNMSAYSRSMFQTRHPLAYRTISASWVQGRSWLIVAGLLLGGASSAMAQPIQWPDNPTIGLIGASFMENDAPDESSLAQAGIGAFVGGSYQGLRYQLTISPLIRAMGFMIQSRAQGGARSFDVPAEGFKGYNTQLSGLLNATVWFDGQTRLKYLVISIMNDCLHTAGTTDGQRCTSSTMAAYVDEIQTVVERAQAAGLTVIVGGYPKWETLDMELARGVFGFPWVINESEYAQLSTMHRDVLSAIPGVIYLQYWNDRTETIDGLHPTHRSMKRAARKIARTIQRHQKNSNPN